MNLGRGPGRASPESPTQSASASSAIWIMLVAVALQVMGAVLLKILADARSDISGLVIVAGIGGVLLLNLVRLVVWGLAHRHYPLSTTFPISSLFFPAMLGVAALYGDAIGTRQIVGAVLITAGALWLTVRTRS